MDRIKTFVRHLTRVKLQQALSAWMAVHEAGDVIHMPLNNRPAIRLHVVQSNLAKRKLPVIGADDKRCCLQLLLLLLLLLTLLLFLLRC